MPWPKEMPIVEVEWVDSNAEGGWSSVEKYEATMEEDPSLLCKSSGYLLHKGKRTLMIVQSQSKKSGNIADSITIPRSAIRSLRIVERPRRAK